MLILNCGGLFLHCGVQIFFFGTFPLNFRYFLWNFGLTAQSELEKGKGKPCLILNLAPSEENASPWPYGVPKGS